MYTAQGNHQRYGGSQKTYIWRCSAALYGQMCRRSNYGDADTQNRDETVQYLEVF